MMIFLLSLLKKALNSIIKIKENSWKKDRKRTTLPKEVKDQEASFNNLIPMTF